MLDEETKFRRPLLWISFFIQIHLYKPEICQFDMKPYSTMPYFAVVN